MSMFNEYVIRIAPDRMTILNSRERTPFLLFVETVEVSVAIDGANGGAKCANRSMFSLLPALPHAIRA